jgi:hypothetical protein
MKLLSWTRWFTLPRYPSRCRGRTLTVERQGQQQFIALAMPAPPLASAPQAKQPGSDIRIEARRGDLQVTVSCPSSAAADCALWLRELLR